jgi:hypothetical protein
MKNNLTEIIFVLDRSGSMSGLESDTIGGYNGFLEKQKKLKGDVLITTVLFDDKYEMLYNGVAIEKATINNEQYFVRGMTALLDAVGKTILDVGTRLSHTAKDERPEKVIFIITTDGMENASREFSHAKVKELITHQQEKYSWEFLFFGANIDSVQTAEHIGISAMDAMNYVASPEGTDDMMFCMNEMVTERRMEPDKNKRKSCSFGKMIQGKRMKHDRKK